MSLEYDPISRRTRAFTASTAVVAACGVVAAVLLLAEHYDHEFLDVARAQATAAAQQAHRPATVAGQAGATALPDHDAHHG